MTNPTKANAEYIRDRLRDPYGEQASVAAAKRLIPGWEIPSRTIELPCPECGELLPVTMTATANHGFDVGIDEKALQLAVSLHVREKHS